MLLRPWAIHATGFEQVPAIVLRHQLHTQAPAIVAAMGGSDPNGDSPPPAYRLQGNVAIVPVRGPMFRGQDDFDEYFARFFGCTTYGFIVRGVQEGLAAPEARAILLDINSPGGDTDGIAEAAAAVYKLRGQGKRIVGVIRGIGASAAYWIGSACDELHIGEATALTGMLGTKCLAIDDSKFQEKMGFRVFEIVSEQTPDKREIPLDDEVVARAQAHVNRMTEVFFADVATYRGVTAGRVRTNYGKGDMFVGSDAVDAGLADSMVVFDDLIVELGRDPAVTPTSPRASSTSSSSLAAPPAARAASQTRPSSAPPAAATSTRRTSMPKNALKKLKAQAAAAAAAAAAAEADGTDAEAKRAEADDLDEKAKGKHADAEAKRAEAKKCEEDADDLDGDGKKEESKAKRTEAKQLSAAADDLDAEAEGHEEEATAMRAEADEMSAEAEDDESDDDDGEKKSMAKLRSMLGVSAEASGREMLRAFQAKFTSMTDVAELRKQVAQLTTRDEQRSKRELTAQAERAVDTAISEGRQEKEKRGLLVEAFVEAEEEKVGTGAQALARHLFPKGMFKVTKGFTRAGGHIAGGPEPGAHLREAPESGQHPSGLPTKGGELVARAKQIMAAEPTLTYAQAEKKALSENPSLYQ